MQYFHLFALLVMLRNLRLKNNADLQLLPFYFYKLFAFFNKQYQNIIIGCPVMYFSFFLVAILVFKLTCTSCLRSYNCLVDLVLLF